ncbi:RdgB/HAM1 family non-canonical purine NTP pyrophosphatase [Adlercreutzia sp. ZJ304]|uniref:RdgB/HAM1 family non-canonical purine NTP pyrophosphatase n=1 Tax=Adlercreutzia sp. ZJ304 TaxID=2709791 RepID=UPI0013ED9CDC|nr:RdgB/HAM1 family non-canonical purine NTP pyrophosphatase [Adlercreutzia sp. ZJ304]
MKVLLATNNAHKADEIRNALNFKGWEFVTLREAGVESDPVEDADSFVGNARIKAQAAHVASGGMCVLADDSGLEVDALSGQPGVYSSRYSGLDGNDAANNALLMKNLEGIPNYLRTARFVCTLVFLDADGAEVVAHGKVEGYIGQEARGEDGFGYDPLFYPIELGGQLSFAEIPQERKSSISHRGRALCELKDKLELVYNRA